MCGICGFTGKPDLALLKGMLSLVWKRGPDEEGMFLDDGISMGIRRLAIVDLKTGSQPISNEDDTITVVFNGEIYNYVELRTELVSRGHVFKTDHSDTECIVHAFEEYGVDFVYHLNGMFAIAIWDSKEQCLHLFRDRMGVKPLYYSKVGSEVVFASEIKCILEHPEVQRRPNFHALRMFFVFRNIPSPMTAFSGIHSLMAGERLVFKKGNCYQDKYYTVSIHNKNDDSEEEAANRVLELLKDAVRIRMRADVPIGAFLSGGVDSSGVATLMKQIGGDLVHTFSLGYHESFPHKDIELDCARMMADRLQTSHHVYRISVDDLARELDHIIGAFDEPFTGVVSTYFLSRNISKYLKVALSGDGSDELFGGYTPALVATPFEEISKSENIADVSKRYKDVFTEGFLDELWTQGEGNLSAVRYYLYIRGGQDPQFFTTEFKNEISKCQSPKEYFLERFPFDGKMSYLNHMLFIDWNFLLPDQVLNYLDKLSMVHSLEIRSPFLDYRLVEYVFSLRPNIKIKNCVGKSLLKKALSGILPESILHRKKEGFVLPLGQWFDRQDLVHFIKSILCPSRLNPYNILDSEGISALIGLHESGKQNNSMPLWNMAVFQLWMEKYFPLGY